MKKQSGHLDIEGLKSLRDELFGDRVFPGNSADLLSEARAIRDAELDWMNRRILSSRDASIRIEEETMAALEEYAKVPIAFTVGSRYIAVPIGSEGQGWELIEEPVDPPWIKDYDGGEPPTRWLRWDTSNWRVFSAFSDDERVGGAIVVHNSSELNYLEGREHLAALWDVRVAPEWRGNGIGSMLFEHVVRYAKSVGCVELKIETQDINVKACDFYAKHGCRLTDVIPDAYPDCPGEVEFTWRLGL